MSILPGNFTLSQLQSENARLRAELDAMTAMARLNQDKMRRFDALERKIIGADSISSLVNTLLVDYKNQFTLDAVSLALIDPEHEAAKLLSHDNSNSSALASGLILLDKAQALQQLLGNKLKPVLCPLLPEHGFLFEDQTAGLVSVALLPLVHHGRLMGSLNLGSLDADRFVNGSSTDFLERLATIAAVCLDGALITERLKLVGLTDNLTGVSNRRYFESRLIEEVTAARRNSTPLACLFLDVDKFKVLNDTHGHPAGDEVLRFIAKVIKVQLRGSDVLSRYGGEEFVALLPVTLQAAALETAERIRRVVAAQSIVVKGGPTLKITLSIGVSMLNIPVGTADAALMASDMVGRADQALYQAKANGRNRVETG